MIALSFVVDQVRREVRVSARISVVRVEQLFVLKIARLSHIIGARRTLRLAVSSPLLLSKLLLLLLRSYMYVNIIKSKAAGQTTS